MSETENDLIDEGSSLEVPRWCWDYEIDRWHFTSRTSDALKNMGVYYLRDLHGLSMSILARYPGFGLDSLKEVADAVRRLRVSSAAPAPRRAPVRAESAQTSTAAGEERYRDWARLYRSNLRFWVNRSASEKTFAELGVSPELVAKLDVAGLATAGSINGLAVADLALNFELGTVIAGKVLLALSRAADVTIAQHRPVMFDPPSSEDVLAARVNRLLTQLEALPRPGVRARIALNCLALDPLLRERIALAGIYHCDGFAQRFTIAVRECELSVREQEDVLRRIWLMWSTPVASRVMEQGYLDDDLASDRLCVARVAAIMGARNMDEELQGLLVGLTDRVRQMVQLRWGMDGSPPVSMEAIGARFKVSRERVRQLVSGDQSKIRLTHFPLPLASMAVQLLHEAGGVLGTHDFVRLLGKHELLATPATLRSLREAEESGVVQVGLRYSAKFRLWFTEEAEKKLVKGGGAKAQTDPLLDMWARERDALGGATFERISRVAPFGLPHAIELIESVEESGVAVLEDCILSRAHNVSTAVSVAIKSLAFAKRVPLEGIANYLRDIKKLDVSDSVLRGTLDAHPVLSIDLDDDSVLLEPSYDASKHLSATERVVLTVMQREGGISLHSDLTVVMQRNGSSGQVAHQVLALPCFIRYDRGIYAIRGTHVSPQKLEQVRGRQKEGRKAKPEEVVD